MNNPFIMKKIKKNPKCINAKLNVLDEKYILYAFECGYTFEKFDIDNFLNSKHCNVFLNKYINDDLFLRYINEKKSIGFINSALFEYLNSKDKILTFLQKNPNVLLQMSIDDIKKYISIDDWVKLCVDNFNLSKMSNYYNDIDVLKSIYKYYKIDELIDIPAIDDIDMIIPKLVEEYDFTLNNIEILSEKFSLSQVNIDDLYRRIILEKSETIQYSDTLPDDLKNNGEYLFRHFSKCENEYPILSEEQCTAVSNYIKMNNIIIDGEIPAAFINCSDIVVSLVRNNNNLIDVNDINEKILYDILIFVDLKNYIISENTPDVLKKKFSMIVNSLNFDFSTIKFFNHKFDYTLEQQLEIYNICKVKEPNFNFLTSPFLMNNCYIVLELLKSGKIDASQIKFDELPCFSEFYPNFIPYIKNKTTIMQGTCICDGIIYIEESDVIKLENKLNLILKNPNYKDCKIRITCSELEDFCYENINYIKDLLSRNLNVEFVTYSSASNYNKQSYIHSVDEIIEMEEFLETCVSEINSSNMSPYEKYLAVYDIVKNFKEYKFEEKGYNHDSRNIYNILKTDAMVCVGYANLLENLLRRVGINAPKVSIDVTGERATNGLDNSSEIAGHARNYVYIKDKKYGIDGYYMADATWDNYNEFNSEFPYVYSNLTINEVTNDKNIKKIESGVPIFKENNDDEFLKLMDKYDTRELLKKLDPTIKIPSSGEFDYISKMIELKKYIETKVNNKISPEVKLDAISNNLKYKYKNITSYDIEIIRNSIIYSYFYDFEKDKPNICEEEFNKFLNLYSQEISGYTIEQYLTERKNSKRNAILQNRIIHKALLKIIKDQTVYFSKVDLKYFSGLYSEVFKNEDLNSKILSNKDVIEECGFKVKLDDEFPDFITVSFDLYKSFDQNLTIIEAVKKLDEKIQFLYNLIDKENLKCDKKM